ncbi:hypothetical protein AURDEDRAFT_164356 [Auricularia subglabra TFB-10046 SS5]|nr:hypothetical protein AURDEDRAFT_164356 [Auricularia subglabra TFB-10046 SS5]
MDLKPLGTGHAPARIVTVYSRAWRCGLELAYRDAGQRAARAILRLQCTKPDMGGNGAQAKPQYIKPSVRCSAFNYSRIPFKCCSPQVWHVFEEQDSARHHC